MHHSAYFDAVLFGRLLLTAFLIVEPGAKLEEIPRRLSKLVRTSTGYPLPPEAVEAVIDGDADAVCTVPMFRAIVEAIEPPGGAHWFDPAFDPNNVAHFWGVCMEREVS